MQLRHRQTIIQAAGLIVAAIIGFGIADGSYLLPGLIAAFALAAIVICLGRLPIDVIVMGIVVFGYIVGNRGFAQLMIPGIPLLPAEAALGLALVLRLGRCAFERRLPFRGDALDWAVLAWMVAGALRFAFDFPRFGWDALRDFATVYYALFYVVVREMMDDPRSRRYLTRALIAGVLVLPVTYSLSLGFPEVFTERIAVRGVPLLFYKGDLVYTVLAAGSVLLFHEARGRIWMRGVALLMGLYVAAGDSRASLLGLLMAIVLLASARRWRYPLAQSGLLAGALAVAVMIATVGDHPGLQQRLLGAQDRVRSLVDPFGQATYTSEDSYFKGDNNAFRTVWWRLVLAETWDDAPLTGLGFGYDLANDFVLLYNPEAADEFNARSPHNIFLTVFGRMGLVGLAVWAWLCVILVAKTWRALRSDQGEVEGGKWTALCVILVSACFGVVLEGPMGAVVFWALLGIAARSEVEPHSVPPELTEEHSGQPDPTLDLQPAAKS